MREVQIKGGIQSRQLSKTVTAKINLLSGVTVDNDFYSIDESAFWYQVVVSSTG